MINICKICGQEVIQNNHYWRVHEIKEADYYQKYIPRFSKQTGQLIKFKNREFYLDNDFNDKREMKTWFKTHPEEAKHYAVDLLKKRFEQKELQYTLSEVELRSLGLPDINWYKKNIGDYNKISKSLGYKKRFDYPDFLPYKHRNLKDEKIYIDTREQLPLNFNLPTETKTLSYGDYTLSNNFGVYIERKTLSDFVNTLGPQVDRFCREIERAKKDKSYLIILVESPLNHALNFNYLPQMKYATKSTPDYVFHNVRKLIQKYKNIQFAFVKGRLAAAEIIIKFYYHANLIKKLDLQYLIDKKFI